MTSKTSASAVTAAKNQTPSVNWDDSAMQTSYANVVNAFSTREEFTLLFGTNLTWNLGDDNKVNIKLSDRIVLNPLVAKRLHTLMGQLLTEYESRYGNLGPAPVETPAAAKPVSKPVAKETAAAKSPASKTVASETAQAKKKS